MIKIAIGSKTESDFPFRECYACENIEQCPHPDVNNEGSPICPEDCKRKDEIKLTKNASI